MKQIAVLIVLLTLLGSALGATPKQKKAAQKTAPPPVQEQQPAPPPVPLTPEQMPATAPRITYQNGMLSITAENSTLGDVLNGVRRATGAALEVPPGVSSERVVVHLGPGQPRDIMQQLLEGSKFDYIIVGSPQNQAALARVILTNRGVGGANMGNTNVATNQPSFQPAQQTNYQPPEDVFVEDEGNVNEMGQQEQPPPGQEIYQPGPPDEAGNVPGRERGGPKTPEQLLQELQRMQQQGQDVPQRPERTPR
ncbi:MAG TPA: hypothetical protein VN577_22595 [Terriglobales bacterium]|nr:hypothetical protein [Terriglobales bacterium]